MKNPAGFSREDRRVFSLLPVDQRERVGRFLREFRHIDRMRYSINSSAKRASHGLRISPKRYQSLYAAYRANGWRSLVHMKTLPAALQEILNGHIKL